MLICLISIVSEGSQAIDPSLETIIKAVCPSYPNLEGEESYRQMQSLFNVLSESNRQQIMLEVKSNPELSNFSEWLKKDIQDQIAELEQEKPAVIVTEDSRPFPGPDSRDAALHRSMHWEREGVNRISYSIDEKHHISSDKIWIPVLGRGTKESTIEDKNFLLLAVFLSKQQKFKFVQIFYHPIPEGFLEREIDLECRTSYIFRNNTGDDTINVNMYPVKKPDGLKKLMVGEILENIYITQNAADEMGEAQIEELRTKFPNTTFTLIEDREKLKEITNKINALQKELKSLE